MNDEIFATDEIIVISDLEHGNELKDYASKIEGKKAINICLFKETYDRLVTCKNTNSFLDPITEKHSEYSKFELINGIFPTAQILGRTLYVLPNA